MLKADPNINCYESTHISLMVIGGFGIMLYTLGYQPNFRDDLATVGTQDCVTYLCRFPVAVVTALSKIDHSQEHSNVFRLKQFGDLYNRWGGPLAHQLPYVSAKPNSAHTLDRYEANESFFYEIMSIARRGVPRLHGCYCTHYSSERTR